MENRNTWDPHPINVTNLGVVQENYETMAESERGAQITAHMNTVALQFHVDKKYKETVKILSNYIRHKTQQIHLKDKLDLTLDQAYLKLKKMNFYFSKKIPRKKTPEQEKSGEVDAKGRP